MKCLGTSTRRTGGLDRLEQEYYAITQALRRIEAGLTDEHGRREIFRATWLS